MILLSNSDFFPTFSREHPLEELAEKIRTLFPLAVSKKHMSGRDLGRMEATPSLLRHAILA